MSRRPAMKGGHITRLAATCIGLWALMLTAMSCADTPLTDYVPENEAERGILARLIQYQESKIACDVGRYLDCFHEKGRFQFGRGTMVSKRELEKRLPGFWTELMSGNPTFYPMNREMVTGDYIRTGQFINPRIVVRQNTADIELTFTKFGWRLRQFMTMVREKEQWVIHRSAWETN